MQYLAIGNGPSRLPRPCVDLNYLSIRINFNDFEENLAALCLLRSCPNLQELEMLVDLFHHTFLNLFGFLLRCLLSLLLIVHVALDVGSPRGDWYWCSRQLLGS